MSAVLGAAASTVVAMENRVRYAPGAVPVRVLPGFKPRRTRRWWRRRSAGKEAA